ncbi:MAG: hypothetical protein JSW55_15805 [Chloroflexota bacterium]|nr:MAG: hypothetical protein JSW55_15805 [Chloroflexota bacterium]
MEGTKPEKPAGEAEQASPNKEEVEHWLRQLPEITKADAERLANEDESLPAWLQAVRAHADDLTDEETDELMAFLRDLEPADGESGSKPAAEEAAVQAKVTSELPDWVAALDPEEKWPETEADEQLSQGFTDAEVTDEKELPSTGQLPGTQPLETPVGLEGIPEQLAGEELPEWLADQPAAQTPVEAEEVPERPTGSARQPASLEAETTRPPTSAPPSDDVKSEPGLQGVRGAEQADAPPAGWGDPEPAADSAEQDPGAEWPDDSHADDLEQALTTALDLPEGEASQESVDQWLDLLEDLPSAEDPDQLEQLMLDSDLEGAEVPDWLRALRLQQASGQPQPSVAGPSETTGPLAGLSGILPAAAMSATGEIRRSAATLEMSKEQRQQAALLRQLTMIEPEQAPVDESAGAEPFLAARTILGLALLSVIVLAWLLPAIGELLPWSMEPTAPSAAEQAWQAIEANAGHTALVAFDYTPSMAGELDSVAAVVLDHLSQSGSHVLTISQIAAGVPMAEQATAQADDLQSDSLGYLPGEATGLRALGACLVQPCDSLAGGSLSEAQQNALADVGLIIVLSADRDSLVGWVEQVGAQSDTTMIAGVTQGLGPVARPYLVSDQLAGLIEGMPIAAAYAETFQIDGDIAAEHLTSLVLAQWLVIGALLAGAIYFGLATSAASAVTKAAKK